MSTDLEREINEYLFFGGPYPNLAKGVSEVPYPVTYVPVKHEGRPHRIVVRNGDKATLHDFRDGWGGYQDEDGNTIGKDEAQAEVDYINGLE